MKASPETCARIGIQTRKRGPWPQERKDRLRATLRAVAARKRAEKLALATLRGSATVADPPLLKRAPDPPPVRRRQFVEKMSRSQKADHDKRWSEVFGEKNALGSAWWGMG